MKVTMTALVEGDPRKAWGPEDNPSDPDDVWEEQEHEFGSLDEAKQFVQSIIDDEDLQHTTTHVEIVGDDGIVLYRKDAGDDLDATREGQLAESLVEPQTQADVLATPLKTIADHLGAKATEVDE